MRTETAEPVRLEDYRPTDHLIEKVDLDVSLDATNTRIVSTLTVRRNPAGKAGAPLALVGDGLDFVAAKLDGKPLSGNAFTVDASGFTLHEPPKRRFTLTIETKLDPSANTRLMGLYRSGGVYCTQCEAEGFRRIAYFLDRPDVMSIYTTRIEADRTEAPVLLGNGDPVEAGDVPGTNRHFAVWNDPHPKPAYLFALVGGDLGHIAETYTTGSGRKVKLGIYVEKGKEARAVWAMDSLVRSLAWDEKVFGLEYDLDVFNVVAVADFNFGAMENKGLNIFNDKYVLADPQTATDQDYANIEAIIAHEYFHNWTGNRITCRDWFQLCLKEGLTVFRDQEFTADERSRPVKRIVDVRNLRAQQFAEDSGPLAHPVRPRAYREINNFYTATVYEKGAELVRMIRTLIGADAFRRGMDLYFQRHDNTAATVEDFVACFRDAGGLDMPLFLRWYEQAGTPKLKVASHHDAAKKRFSLAFSQSTPATPGQEAKQPVLIPVALGLIGEDGGEMTVAPEGGPATNGVFAFAAESATLIYRDVPARPVPSVLRGFSAPVNLEIDLSDDDLLHLLRFDTDPFNRWQAGQSRATRALIRSVAAIRESGTPRPDSGFVAALGEFLARDALADPAFGAQVLILPGESDIAREIGADIDPDAIHRARRAMREDIGRTLASQLMDTRAALATPGAYSPDAKSAGRRSLASAALALYAAGDPERGGAAAAAQFANADNLTERLAGLAVLADIPGRAREAALRSFAEQYANEPLVLDKWFGLQASIPDADTLDRVRHLMTHQAFSLKNPNRARSLLGGFANGNPRQFNRPDGAGYDFLADNVLAIDRFNPQVAARLATAFRTWRMLEAGRRARARAALERIADAPDLSRDLSDIVTRSLA